MRYGRRARLFDRREDAIRTDPVNLAETRRATLRFREVNRDIVSAKMAASPFVRRVHIDRSDAKTNVRKRRINASDGGRRGIALTTVLASPNATKVAMTKSNSERVDTASVEAIV